MEGFFRGDADRAKQEDWGKAYVEYVASSNVISKFSERYNNHNKPRAKMNFLGFILGLTMVIEILVAIISVFVAKKSVMQIIGTMLITLVITVLSAVIIRWLYYYWMDFQLMLASSRITALRQAWRDIRDIANSVDDKDTIPPEPKRNRDREYPYDPGLAGYYRYLRL